MADKIADTLAPLEDAATEIQSFAKRLMHRENTGFLHHMEEILGEANECLTDGELDDDSVDEYREAMVELAAYAMAQAALTTKVGSI